MARPSVRIVYSVLTQLFLVAILLQGFAAGLSVFAGQGWQLHRMLGQWIGFFPLLQLILAFAGGFPRTTKVLAAALLIGFIALMALVMNLRHPAWLAATHPPLAIAFFGLALTVAFDARRNLSS